MQRQYRDITKKALELGLLRTAGQTPAATLSSQIGTEIARQEQRGEIPRFVRHGKGKVSLSRWHKQAQPRELAKLIKQHNDEVALEPEKSENFLTKAVRAMRPSQPVEVA